MQFRHHWAALSDLHAAMPRAGAAEIVSASLVDAMEEG